MTNEEKAKSLWYHFCTEKSCEGHSNCVSCPKSQVHPQLLEMAKWKDENFDAFLDYLIVLGDKDIIDAICDYRGEKLEE